MGAFSCFSRMLLVFVFSVASYAEECANNTSTDTELLTSNICSYEVTAVVRIESDWLQNWYNPLAYFKGHMSYKYDVTLIDTIKGDSVPDVFCLIESTDSGSPVHRGIEGEIYIVSFDRSDSCFFIDVGGMMKANSVLLDSVKGGV